MLCDTYPSHTALTVLTVSALDLDILKGKRDLRGVQWQWNKTIQRQHTKESALEGRGAEKE